MISSRNLIYAILLSFGFGCTSTLTVLYLGYGNDQKIDNTDDLELNKYSIVNFEDGFVKEEGYRFNDTIWNRYNIMYYRYPIEKLMSLRIFIDTSYSSNISRDFYRLNFDTAGYLVGFDYFEKGVIKYQDKFDESTRISKVVGEY